MFNRFTLTMLCFLSATLAIPLAVDAGTDPKESVSSADAQELPPGKPEAAKDPFDFDGVLSPESTPVTPLLLDERIKVRVEPVVRSTVVDRVIEPARISVKAPGFSRVEFFLEPVDAPFGGKSLGEPKLIGQSNNYREFTYLWSSPVPHEYVKIFVLAYKNDGTSMGRSRAIDLGIGGNKLKPVPELPPVLPPP